MIDQRDEIPVEELDSRIKSGCYTLVKTGGYHPFRDVALHIGNEKYGLPIWPYIKKLNGYHQKLNLNGKINGSVSLKQPYVNWTLYANTKDSDGRDKRVKVYAHVIIAKAWSNPNSHKHKSDGGDYVVNHKNEKPADYRIENLELLTIKDNSIGYPKNKKKDRQFIYEQYKHKGWV